MNRTLSAQIFFLVLGLLALFSPYFLGIDSFQILFAGPLLGISFGVYLGWALTWKDLQHEEIDLQKQGSKQ